MYKSVCTKTNNSLGVGGNYDSHGARIVQSLILWFCFLMAEAKNDISLSRVFSIPATPTSLKHMFILLLQKKTIIKAPTNHLRAVRVLTALLKFVRLLTLHVVGKLRFLWFKWCKSFQGTITTPGSSGNNNKQGLIEATHGWSLSDPPIDNTPTKMIRLHWKRSKRSDSAKHNNNPWKHVLLVQISWRFAHLRRFLLYNSRQSQDGCCTLNLWLTPHLTN